MLNNFSAPFDNFINSGIMFPVITRITYWNSNCPSPALWNDMVKSNAFITRPRIPIFSANIAGKWIARIIPMFSKNSNMSIAKAIIFYGLFTSFNITYSFCRTIWFSCSKKASVLSKPGIMYKTISQPIMPLFAFRNRAKFWPSSSLLIKRLIHGYISSLPIIMKVAKTKGFMRTITIRNSA